MIPHSILLLALLAWKDDDRADSVPSVQFIDEKILAQRLGIKSAVIEIEGDRNFKGTDLHTSFNYKFFFDNESIRSDFSSAKVARETRSFSNREKQTISFVDGGEQRTLMIKHAPNIPRRGSGSGYQDLPLDPRLLGIWPSSILNLVYQDLDFILSKSARKSSEVKEVTEGTRKLYEVTYLYNDKLESSLKYIVDPDQGYNVVRAAYKFSSDPLAKDTRIVESRLVQLGSSGIWFPSELNYSEDSEKQSLHERATIKVIKFNQPIEPSVFNLEGMSIPADTVAVFQTPEIKGPRRWNGSSLEKIANLREKLKGVNPAAPVSKWKIVLYVNAAIFGLLAIVFIWKWSRRNSR